MPQGYLRVLSFTEDSVLVDQRTVQLSATALNNYDTLQTGPLVVQHNCYVSVYVGNDSAADVYFDDVRVEHRPGLQVQENQYDPFGLDLAGVSGAAPGLRLKNFYQFNGKENQLDLGLNWNHQDWRFYDYQIGQWHAVDPEIENGQESWTPYSFGYDNGVRYADANGRNPGGGGGPTLLQADLSVVANELTLLLEEAGTVIQNSAIVVGLTGAAAWVGNHLPSLEQVGDALSHTSPGAAAFPGQYSPYMQMYTDSKMRASVKDANGRVEARKRPVTEKKAENLEKNKDVPKTQLGPSGKPKINTVNKPTMKRARDAARNNPKSNSAPQQHLNDEGQPGHFHATRDGEKLGGKDNTHYAYPSPVNPPKAKE